jgi:DNA-binding LacI/PurR family transcriptional regulator
LTTIRELAELLGVSVATVSRSLNDKPGVSSEMRQKVLAMAKELNYHPNRTALNLTTAQTRNILFVIHRRLSLLSADPFYPYIMQGMEEILTNEGYGVTLVTITDDQITKGARSLRVLQEHRGDAVVLAGPDIPPNFIIEAATLSDHTLLVDNTLQETPLPAVIADNQGGSNAITNHLIKVHGHEEVVMLRGPQGWISSEERTRGYLAAMNAAGLQAFVVYAEDTTVETGQETMKQALKEKPNTTAVVAVNDAMAIGALRTARELGYSTPHELAIVGFDNISWASYTDPPLTTVRIPKLDMGRIAARSLLDHLNGSVSSPSRIIVATQLIIRESCGCEVKL